MAFADRVAQVLTDKNRENAFSGAVLIKQGEEDLFKAALRLRQQVLARKEPA